MERISDERLAGMLVFCPARMDDEAALAQARSELAALREQTPYRHVLKTRVDGSWGGAIVIGVTLYSYEEGRFRIWRKSSPLPGVEA